MSRYLKRVLTISIRLIALISLFVAGRSEAWTSAHLFNVSVTVDLAQSGPSTVTTDARFIVEAGYFHGFDFAKLPGAELDKSAAVAFQDDQRAYPVTFKRVRGRIRVLLADDKYIRGGGVTFRIVHKIDFAEIGALKSRDGRARLDWTPLVWDVGLDNMRVIVRLPESEGKARIRIDKDAAKDYVTTVDDELMSFIKFRPVKWYPMRIVASFDADRVSELPPDEPSIKKEPRTAPAAASIAPPSNGPTVPLEALALFAAVCLFGWATSAAKALHIRAAYRAAGKEPVFLLLRRTDLSTRAILSLCAVIAGGVVQAAGHAAAGIPLFVAAAALFVVHPDRRAGKPRPGGSWREMNDADLTAYTRLYREYKKTRTSLFDITVPKGAAAFVCVAVALIYIPLNAPVQGTEVALLMLVDSALLVLPTWFSGVRSELPMDSTLEGYGLLQKWRNSLRKLIGAHDGIAEPRFFVREDESGPIEVRLRARPDVEGLRNIETAAEEFTAGTVHRVRTVFLLRLEPGAPITRKLAASPHAAEHHLTPDLKEEIIVLRNRRGKTAAGLTPLRCALDQL